MLELSAMGGYQNASIAQISSRASVSSATFYEQFADKEECMLAAYRTAAQRIFASIQPAETAPDWLAAAGAALDGLLGAVQRDPHAARVLFVEALGGGRQLYSERKRVVTDFETRAQRLLDSASQDGSTVDVPVAALTGAIRNIVARHLRTHAEDRLSLLTDDLLTWVASYATPASIPRWSTGPDALLPKQAARRLAPAPGAPTRMPTRLPRGRHGLPAGVVARSHRTRILYGTAEATMAKGYAHATVADIVAAAGVARDVFYEHFADKQHAFLEAQQHPTQHILDACAVAYFAARDWPERMWNYLRTLIGLITENPAISHLRLVECYAAGPAAIRRAEEITRAFGIFLEEGYSYRPEARDHPRMYSQAITGAMYEIIQRRVARGETSALARQLPQLVYIAIAPFTGASEAIGLVQEISSRHAPTGRA
jgi:AcrR family transcriptional regulator